VSSDRDSLRAADVDREFVAERLRAALNEGRLTLTEYDDRLQEAYQARTYGDLKMLLADLPTTAPVARSQVVPAASQSVEPVPVPPGHVRHWVAAQWSGWVTTSVILTAIWFVAGGGHPHGDFWPAWVIGIWGAVLVATTINGLASGEPRKKAEREARRRVEREQRRAAEQQERFMNGDSKPDKQS
jgi:hypothetical protein